jgi:hypothetical protein
MGKWTINTSCPQGRRRRYDRRWRLRRHHRGCTTESLTDKIGLVDRPRFRAYVTFARFLSSLIFYCSSITQPVLLSIVRYSGTTTHIAQARHGSIRAHEKSETSETDFNQASQVPRGHYGLFSSGLESPFIHLRGSRSAEPQLPLGTPWCPIERRKGSLGRPLSMPGGPQMCFRVGSAFGTGMVIEEHYEAVWIPCVTAFSAWARLTHVFPRSALPDRIRGHSYVWISARPCGRTAWIRVGSCDSGNNPPHDYGLNAKGMTGGVSAIALLCRAVVDAIKMPLQASVPSEI